jgi:hypothetical protein
MRNAVIALVGLIILLAVFAFLFAATASQM